jgi:hypothetical protein
LIPARLKRNWINHSLGAGVPFTAGGVNFHFLAASIERRAKYWLGPRVTKLASLTFPELSTFARTVMRKWPLIVLIALGATAGITRLRTRPAPGLALSAGGGADLVSPMSGLGFAAGAADGFASALLFGGVGAGC